MSGVSQMWCYTYDKYGGYDGITGGFIIKKDDREILVVDLCVFGQNNNGDECPQEGMIKAEKFAKRIVGFLNTIINIDDDGIGKGLSTHMRKNQRSSYTRHRKNRYVVEKRVGHYRHKRRE